MAFLLTGILLPAGLARGQEEHVVQGASLSLHVPPGVADDDAHRLLEHLETASAALQSKLHRTQPDLTFQLLPAGRYETEAGPAESWKPATLRQNAVLLRVPPGERGWQTLYQYAAYTVARASLDSAIAHQCPLWFAEAFAVHFAGLPEQATPPERMLLTSFQDLNQEIQQHPRPPRRSEVEFLLEKTMEFFNTAFGEEKTLRALQSFDGSMHSEQVFKKMFGVDAGQIEQRWAKYLRDGIAPRKPRNARSR